MEMFFHFQFGNVRDFYPGLFFLLHFSIALATIAIGVFSDIKLESFFISSWFWFKTPCISIRGFLFINNGNACMKKIVKMPVIVVTDLDVLLVQLLADDFTREEISKIRGVSAAAIDAHVYRLIRKVGCKRVPGLVVAFFRNGLIK